MSLLDKALKIVNKLDKNSKEKLLEKLLEDTNMKKCEECEKFLPENKYDFYECNDCGAEFCDDCRIDYSVKCIKCRDLFCGDCIEKNIQDFNLCKKCNDKIEK